MRLKNMIFLSLLLGFLLIQSDLYAQELEIKQILAQREASNKALKNFDEELNNTFMTDDVLITTGAGTLLSGKAKLIEYINQANGPKMYWVRTPDEILVNPETQLAWETGTWKGDEEGSSESVVRGNYTAQWTKKSGTWLIQSQLFVTLPEGGWIAIRAYASKLKEDTWPSMHARHFAHSSPIWIEAIRSTDSHSQKAAAADLIRAIDASERIAKDPMVIWR